MRHLCPACLKDVTPQTIPPHIDSTGKICRPGSGQPFHITITAQQHNTTGESDE